MNWEQLRENIYFIDGSLRDIYIFDTTEKDWQIWVEFVNENYPVTFPNYDLATKQTQIDFNKVLKGWDDLDADRYTASVYLDGIKVNAHFFIESEIENDITPTEINSIDDHLKLLEYMKKVSTLLNKKVVLTPENMPNEVLIMVYHYEVIITLS
ncbi:hypothetical protein [Mucilaginibacter boryungensis]|uniref:Immunity protein 22 of polymorphic toxin system n=1 Tax=Mucilaginibacter boryungensis TaxID=768480 RepID=A0ABR9XI72_9SPHI|nr:hypothetical protein [Mucilaginibacter boryungensis]MBE9667088.1 hypothetical protein [Mucilaginibacter boryungensis]